MTYSVMSTRTFAALGDFDEEGAAQHAVCKALSDAEAQPSDLLVMVFDDDGNVVDDYQDGPLAEWAGVRTPATSA